MSAVSDLGIANSSYRKLDASEVITTAQALCQRVEARFPSSDLVKVSRELLQITNEAQARSEWMGKPILILRVMVFVFIAIFIGVLICVLDHLHVVPGQVTVTELLQGIEAATNEIILLGAGLLFLGSAELRLKRSRGLKAIHELRSMAHIIDMHQLTKDPARLDKAPILWTSVSPTIHLDAFHLTRYLDYCSELLSLLGKIAAIYAQDLHDPVLLSSVDEVETLTGGFSRKIWQKIMIVEAARDTVS